MHKDDDSSTIGFLNRRYDLYCDCISIWTSFLYGPVPCLGQFPICTSSLHAPVNCLHQIAR